MWHVARTILLLPLVARTTIRIAETRANAVQMVTPIIVAQIPVATARRRLARGIIAPDSSASSPFVYRVVRCSE